MLVLLFLAVSVLPIHRNCSPNGLTSGSCLSSGTACSIKCVSHAGLGTPSSLHSYAQSVSSIGDTLLLEPSSTSYPSMTITKGLVVRGVPEGVFFDGQMLQVGSSSFRNPQSVRIEGIVFKNSAEVMQVWFQSIVYSLTLSDVVFDNCGIPTPDKGTLHVRVGKLVVQGCTWMNSNARAINLQGAFSLWMENTTMKDIRVGDSVSGTGVCCGPIANRVDIVNSTFSNLTTLQSGGVIHLTSSIVTISNSEFRNCHARYAGAIHRQAETTIVSQSRFIGNSAETSGGAMRILDVSADSSVLIDSCEFVENRAATGGALSVDFTLSDGVYLTNSTFCLNYANSTMLSVTHPASILDNCTDCTVNSAQCCIQHLSFGSNCTQCTFDGCTHDGCEGYLSSDQRILCLDECPSTDYIKDNRTCGNCDYAFGGSSTCKNCSSLGCTEAGCNGWLSRDPIQICLSSCPIGQYGGFGPVCELCSDFDDGANCSECVSTGCTACNGFLSSDQVSLCVSTCPDSDYVTRGNTTCGSCFEDFSASLACTRCTSHGCTGCSGDLSLDQKCLIECPHGQYSNSGVCQYCPIGKYQPKAGKSCKDCPAGGICNEVGQVLPQVKPGWWAAPGSDNIRRCSPLTFCLGDRCAYGRTGELCVECRPNHYPRGDECIECPQKTPLYFPSLILVAILICILFIAVRGSSSPAARIGLNWIQVLALLPTYRVPWPWYIVFVFEFLQTLGLNIDVLAPECQVDMTWQAKWVAQLIAPFGFAGVFLIIYVFVALYTIIVSQCICRVFGPLVSNTLDNPSDDEIIMARNKLSEQERNQVRGLFDRFDTDHKEYLNRDDISKAIEESEGKIPSLFNLNETFTAFDGVHENVIQWEEFEHWAIERILRRQWKRWCARSLMFGLPLEDFQDFRYKCQGGFVQFLWLVYLTLAHRSIELFDCTKQPLGDQTLDAYPLIYCYTPDWYSMLPISLVSLLLYVIGIPVFFLILLIRGRKYLKSKPVKARLGSMFRHYRIEDDSDRSSLLYCLNKRLFKTYWWEVMIFARKIGVLLPALFLTIHPREQIVATMIVLGVCFLATVVFLPYKYHRDNFLEGVTLLQSILVYGTGIVFFELGAIPEEAPIPDDKASQVARVRFYFALLLIVTSAGSAIIVAVILGLDIWYWRKKSVAGRTRRIKSIKVTSYESKSSSKSVRSMVSAVIGGGQTEVEEDAVPPGEMEFAPRWSAAKLDDDQSAVLLSVIHETQKSPKYGHRTPSPSYLSTPPPSTTSPRITTRHSPRLRSSVGHVSLIEKDDL